MLSEKKTLRRPRATPAFMFLSSSALHTYRSNGSLAMHQRPKGSPLQLLGRDSFVVTTFSRSPTTQFQQSYKQAVCAPHGRVAIEHRSIGEDKTPTTRMSRALRMQPDAITHAWPVSERSQMEEPLRSVGTSTPNSFTSLEITSTLEKTPYRNTVSQTRSEKTERKLRGNGPIGPKATYFRGTRRSGRSLSAGRAALLGPAAVLIQGNEPQRRQFMVELQRGNITLSIEQFNEVLSGMLRLRRVRDASVFAQLWDREPFLSLLRKNRAIKTYTIMIDAYGKCGQLARAFSLFYSMNRAGPKPNVITYNAMIAACARNNEPNMAYQIFKEMQTSGIRPDKFTYGSLIDSCAKGGHVDRAFQISEAMDQNGVAKDQTIYSALMDACGRAKQLDRALLVYEEMKRNAVWPNLITFSVLIDTCANARQPEKAFQLFSEIKHWGYPRANVVVYTALIDACSKGGWPERAERVMDSMVANGIRPNEISFGALMDGWTREGQINRAFDIIERMVNVHRVFPNAVLIGGLIDASRRLKEPYRAKAIWSVVVKYNIRPSRTYYPALVAMAARNGDLHVASAIALHAYARGSLRRVALHSENPTLHAMACAIAYLMHSIRNDSNSSHEVKKQHFDRLRVVFNSTAMRPDQLNKISPDTAYRSCTSWNHTESKRSRVERRHNAHFKERGSSTTKQFGRGTLISGLERSSMLKNQNRPDLVKETST